MATIEIQLLREARKARSERAQPKYKSGGHIKFVIVSNDNPTITFDLGGSAVIINRKKGSVWQKL